MSPSIVRAVIIAILCFTAVRAEVIHVKVGDPSIVLDQRIFENGPDCNDRRTYIPDATIQFNFTGTAVTIIGSTGHSGGVHQGFVDGKLEYTYDRYAPELHCGKIFLEKTGLEYVEHSVVMVLQRNSSKGEGLPGYMPIIEFQYTTPDQTSSVTPSSSTTTTQPSSSIIISSYESSTVGDGTKSVPMGAIIGAVVGGIAVLVAIIILIWCLFFRKTRKERYQNGADDNYVPGITPFTVERSSPGPVSFDSRPNLLGSSPWPSDVDRTAAWAGGEHANSKLGLFQPPMTSSYGGGNASATEWSPSSLVPSSPLSGKGAERTPTAHTPSVATMPLLDEDVQRIAQAVVAHTVLAQGEVAAPPAYR